MSIPNGPPEECNDRTGGASAKRGRRIATIRRFGRAIVITPPDCAAVLAPLRTERHLVGIDSELRGRMIKEAKPFIIEARGLREERILRCPAGLESIACHLLEQAGYQVRMKGCRRRPLAGPDIARVEQHGPIDHGLLELVHGHERGLIRYDRPGTDPAWLVAQIALAYPRTQIAVLAATEADVRWIARRLREHLSDVTFATAGSLRAECGRVLVSTYWQLGCPVLKSAERWIVIVLDVVEALAKKPLAILRGATPEARLFGLMDRGRTIAPRDRDWITALFGTDQVVSPRHGHRERPVEVVSHRISGGPALMPGDGVVGLKRSGLWHHPVRNRLIARLARQLADGDLEVGDGGIRVDVDFPPPSPSRRVAVLVENVEHALALADLLPGWSILARAEALATGLSFRHAGILSDRRWACEELPARAIATMETLGALGLSELGVLVRADGGVALPSALKEGLVVIERTPRPLLLVDFADRHHPVLRRRWHSRREAYTARGWPIDGVPPPSMIERFLASRPKVTS